MTVQEKLAHIIDQDVGRIEANADLRHYCTWKIGGSADLLVEPENKEQLSLLLKVINRYDIPSIIIGNGSNLLFSDDGVRGVVIRLGKNFSAINIVDNIVEVQAGTWAPCLARRVAQAGLSGLEHIVGIPATIGGLVVMNGGSKRQSISEVIREVEVMTRDGECLTLGKSECNFSYRRSIFQEEPFVVTGVKLELQRCNDNIRGAMLTILRERRQKFPLHYPSCGSVFKSIPEIYERYGPPGKIIENLGLKGRKVGGAAVSEQHANFIVNTGNATAQDVLNLINCIRDTVYRELGVWLPCEVRLVSSSGTIDSVGKEN